MPPPLKRTSLDKWLQDNAAKKRKHTGNSSTTVPCDTECSVGDKDTSTAHSPGSRTEVEESQAPQSSRIGSVASIVTKFHPASDYRFPKNAQGRACLPEWFEKFRWLHYNCDSDSALCYECVAWYTMKCENSVRGAEVTFISPGFRNWKKATEKFRTHEKSECHSRSVDSLLQRLQKAPVIKLLSEQSLKEQNEARTALRVVFSSIRYLARSGQALRGHSYEDGNLRLLLDERSQDVPAWEMWMKRRDKWLSADVQNEVIEIMSHELLRGIIQEVKHSTFFSIIADGTTDVSSSEQFSLCIRFVDPDTFHVKEIFVGLYNPSDTTAATLFAVIKDMIMRLGLDFQNLRGQC
ncbi:unnamed protein product, partial [Ixodes hexagonus]